MMPKLSPILNYTFKYWLTNIQTTVGNGALFPFAWSLPNSALPSLLPLSRGGCMPRRCSTLDGGGTDTPEGENKDANKLRKWLQMCRYEGVSLPENITELQFESLLKLPTLSQRYKYLAKLCARESSATATQERKAKTKEALQAESEARLEVNTTGHIRYGLWNNSMFAKVSTQTMTDLQHHRLASAVTFGQPLIVDLGFEEHMSPREISTLSQEVISSMHMNRKSSDPFNLIICNADLKSDTMAKITKTLSKLFPTVISSQSYLDMFPREKLVYLSPDARSELTKFDPDAVYIIGGIVEVSRKDPFTLAKAKKDKIAVKKLPLDRYCVFKRHKSLSVPIVTSILLDVQETGDWRQAFKRIPAGYMFSKEEREGASSSKLNQQHQKKRRKF